MWRLALEPTEKKESRMAKIKSEKSDLELAQRLHKISKQKATIEKEYKQLRGYFINQLSKKRVNALSLGNIALSITKKKKTKFDRKGLIAKMGEKFVLKFSKITHFKQLNIEKIAVEQKLAA